MGVEVGAAVGDAAVFKPSLPQEPVACYVALRYVSIRYE